MVRIHSGIASRTVWYDRHESVGPGSSTRAGPDSSPRSVYESVTPLASATLKPSVGITGS